MTTKRKVNKNKYRDKTMNYIPQKKFAGGEEKKF